MLTVGPAIWRETCNKWKMRNTQCRTLNMSKKLTNEENEKIMVGSGIWRETLKSMENEKCTLQDLQYGEKTEKHGK